MNKTTLKTLHGLPAFINKDDDSAFAKISDALFSTGHDYKYKSLRETVNEIKPDQAALNKLYATHIAGLDETTTISITKDSMPVNLVGQDTHQISINSLRAASLEEYEDFYDVLPDAAVSDTDVTYSATDTLVKILPCYTPLYKDSNDKLQVLVGSYFYVLTSTSIANNEMYLCDKDFNQAGTLDLQQYSQTYGEAGFDLWINNKDHTQPGVFLANGGNLLRTESLPNHQDYLFKQYVPVTDEDLSTPIETFTLQENIIDLTIIDTETGDVFTSYTFNAATGTITFGAAVPPNKYVVEYTYLPFSTPADICLNMQSAGPDAETVHCNSGLLRSYNDMTVLNQHDTIYEPLPYILKQEGSEYSFIFPDDEIIRRNVKLQHLGYSYEDFTVEAGTQIMSDADFLAIDMPNILVTDASGDKVNIDPDDIEINDSNFVLSDNLISSYTDCDIRVPYYFKYETTLAVIESSEETAYFGSNYYWEDGELIWSPNPLWEMTDFGYATVSAVFTAAEIFSGRNQPAGYIIGKHNTRVCKQIEYVAVDRPAQTFYSEEGGDYRQRHALLDAQNRCLDLLDIQTGEKTSIDISTTSMTPLYMEYYKNYAAVLHTSEEDNTLDELTTLTLKFYNLYTGEVKSDLTITDLSSHLDTLAGFYFDQSNNIVFYGPAGTNAVLAKYTSQYADILPLYDENTEELVLYSKYNNDEVEITEL